MFKFFWVKHPIFLFIFFLNSAVSAQNMKQVDSLRQRLNQTSGKTRFDVLTALGFEYRYSFPDSTIYYCHQAFELGEKLGLPKELSKPLSFSGLAFANKGDFKKALELHERAIVVAQQQVDSTQLAFGYNNLGRMFFDGGDMVRAYDNFIRAKTIFDVLNDKSGLAYVNRSLANIYKFQKEYTKAIEMSTKAYMLRKELGDYRAIISSLLELGLIYKDMGNSEMALEKFNEANKLSDRINDKVTLAELKVGRAEILYEKGDFTEAKENAELVLNTITVSTNQRLYIRASLLLGKYYLAKKDLKVAEQSFLRVYNQSDPSGNLAALREASYYLAETYKQLNQDSLAKDYTNSFKIYDEKLQNRDLTQQIERLQFLLQIENQEKENERLKATEARNREIISQQRFQNYLLIVVAGFLATLSGVTWYNSRKRNMANMQLEQQNHHIVEQRSEIESQNRVLSERNRQLSALNHEKDTLMNIVAHDLKSPLNRIFGLVRILELTGGLNDSQREYLTLMKNSTKSGINLISDLLDVNSLGEAGSMPKVSKISLKEVFDEKIGMLQSSAEAKAIKIEVATDFSSEFVTDQEFVSRILDNLLSNAIKFSPSDSVIQVNARVTPGTLTLAVRDQGPGFSEEDKLSLFQPFTKLSARPTAGESSNGLGLAIVKKLVDRLFGSIQLETEAGRGSTFTVTIPEASDRK